MFTEGSEVTEGQQLYQIDPASYQAVYDSAKAALAKAEATLAVDRLTEHRQKKLADTHVIAPQDYDTTFATMKEAEADVALNKASVETAHISQTYTKVLSPISGRIGRSSVTEGALVTNGQTTALATVQQLDPIYVDVFNAHAEHSMLGGLPRMGSILRRVKEAMPTVTAINLPLSGMARSHLYMSMKKRVDGEPKIAACAAFAVDPLLKHIFVVDDDVDVFNEVDVLWMLATRFQADRDLVIMPNFLGGHLNPVTYGFHREEKGPMETKLIFDCTKPAPPATFPPICRVPPDVVKRVEPEKFLKDYVPGTSLASDGAKPRVKAAAKTPARSA